MNCEDLMKFLNDYIDGDVDESFCSEFEKHMEGCNPCRVVVDNIKRTITLYKGNEIYDLPGEVKTRMNKTLKDKWEALQKEAGK